MEQKPDGLEKLKKRLLGTAAGAVAATSLAAGALFDSPAELLAAENEADEAAGQAKVVSVGKRVEPSAGERARKADMRLSDRLRALFLSLPAVVRAVVLLPMWCVGRAGVVLAGLLASALAPVWQIVLGVLLNALLVFGLFALVYKLLFPNRSLKNLFRRRNLIALVCGSLVLSVADALLRRYLPGYTPVSVGIRLALGLAVLALLCLRIFGKRAKRSKRAGFAAAPEA